MSETAPLAKQSPQKDIKSFIQSDAFKNQVAMALPKHMTPDRFCRVALTACLKTPQLLKCSRESLLSCMIQCSQFGLEPDGRHAHLIPYKDACTLIIDYKGLIALAKRSGEIRDIGAMIVKEKDEFDWVNGVVTHRIDWRNPRGESQCVYSYVEGTDGVRSYEVMTMDEVKAVRGRSKSANSGPWVTDFDEMAKKTVIRRHSKRLTLSPEFMDAVTADDDDYRAERPAIVREVPTAKVPDMFALPAKAQESDLTLSADEPTALEQFWRRIQAAGLNRDAVEDYLVESEVIAFPADLTDEIAAGLLPEARFSAIVKALGGAA